MLADAVLPAQVSDLLPRLRGLQDRDDLFLRESALPHQVLPTTTGGLAPFPWRQLRGAGHDFMHDTLYGGRRFRTLNVLDEANREALAIEVGASIPATRVVRVLEQLLALYGRPQALRLDNGPELTAEVFTAWCDAQQIALRYIQPGKPDQNAFIERFNRTYREEVLDAYVFASLSEVQALTDDWLLAYNERRPHDALGRIPPTRFLPRPPAPAESSSAWCP